MDCSSAPYTAALIVVRTDAGLSESIEEMVGLHQWMLSPVRQKVVYLPSC